MLWKNQHGVCKGKLYLTKFLEFFERLYKHLTKSEPVDIYGHELQKKAPHQTKCPWDEDKSSCGLAAG